MKPFKGRKIARATENHCFEYCYDPTKELLQKYCHNYCVPNIQPPKCSRDTFSSLKRAEVSKPLWLLHHFRPIESIVSLIILNIVGTILIFHTVNPQCCGWLRWAVDDFCGQYGLIDDASNLKLLVSSLIFLHEDTSVPAYICPSG